MSNKLRNGLFGLAAIVALAIGVKLSEHSERTNTYEPRTDERVLDVKENPRANKEDKENKYDVFAEYTAQFEGRRNHVYDPRPNDGKPEPTIGIGHYLDRGDSRETFARVLPDVDYDAVYTGKAVLTDTQIDTLFAEDLKKYVQRAKKLIPKFDDFPVTLQTALVDMTYRGDLGDSPRMRSLLNNGKIREATDEYINRAEYKNAEKNGVRGVKTRIDSNRQRLINYAQELEETNVEVPEL